MINNHKINKKCLLKSLNPKKNKLINELWEHFNDRLKFCFFMKSYVTTHTFGSHLTTYFTVQSITFQDVISLFGSGKQYSKFG